MNLYDDIIHDRSPGPVPNYAVGDTVRITKKQSVGESAPRRDGAQDETRRFANPAIASYLFIVLEHAYQYLIYVCLHSFASVRDIRTHR